MNSRHLSRAATSLTWRSALVRRRVHGHRHRACQRHHQPAHLAHHRRAGLLRRDRRRVSDRRSDHGHHQFPVYFIRRVLDGEGHQPLQPQKRRTKPSLSRKPLLSPPRRSCWRRSLPSSSSEMAAVPPQQRHLTTQKRKNLPLPSAKKYLTTQGLYVIVYEP